jgi:hypothetical protein
MIDKDHGILSDASAEGPPFDTLNRADYWKPCCASRHLNIHRT